MSVIPVSKRWMTIIFGALILLMPVLGPSSYVMYVINIVMIYAICTMALNLLTGVGGQVSIGHAAFLAIGAYSSAIMDLRLGIPFWVSIVIAGLITGVIGFIVGLPAVRLTGHYLAIATLGFGVAIPQIALKWESLTGGYMGLSPRNPVIGTFVFDGEVSFYYLIIGVLALTYWTMKNILRSRFGRVFYSIRDSEIAAQAMGIHLPTYKAFLFAVSGFYTGVAGSLYAHSVGFISPYDFSIEISFLILAMMVVGGLASLGGSIAGAAILFLISQWTSHLHGLSAVITGGVLIAVILFFPNGSVGLKDLAVRILVKTRIITFSTSNKEVKGSHVS
jgi:branched-chain amino acid transport system permease protein